MFKQKKKSWTVKKPNQFVQNENRKSFFFLKKEKLIQVFLQKKIYF